MALVVGRQRNPLGAGISSAGQSLAQAILVRRKRKREEQAKQELQGLLSELGQVQGYDLDELEQRINSISDLPDEQRESAMVTIERTRQRREERIRADAQRVAAAMALGEESEAEQILGGIARDFGLPAAHRVTTLAKSASEQVRLEEELRDRASARTAERQEEGEARRRRAEAATPEGRASRALAEATLEIFGRDISAEEKFRLRSGPTQDIFSALLAGVLAGQGIQAPGAPSVIPSEPTPETRSLTERAFNAFVKKHKRNPDPTNQADNEEMANIARQILAGGQ